MIKTFNISIQVTEDSFNKINEKAHKVSEGNVHAGQVLQNAVSKASKNIGFHVPYLSVELADSPNSTIRKIQHGVQKAKAMLLDEKGNRKELTRQENQHLESLLDDILVHSIQFNSLTDES